MKGMRSNNNRIPLVTPNSTLTTSDVMSRNRDIRDRTPEDELVTTLGI
jgi:hypothetical protein